jgi:hypothetical protein
MKHCCEDLQWYLNTNRYYIIKDDVEYLAGFLRVPQNDVRAGIKVRKLSNGFVAYFTEEFLDKARIPGYKSMSEVPKWHVPRIRLCKGASVAYESESDAMRALVLHALFNFQLLGVLHWMTEKLKIHPELAIGMPVTKQFERGEVVAFIYRTAGNIDKRPAIWAHWVNSGGSLIRAFEVTKM